MVMFVVIDSYNFWQHAHCQWGFVSYLMSINLVQARGKGEADLDMIS